MTIKRNTALVLVFCAAVSLSDGKAFAQTSLTDGASSVIESIDAWSTKNVWPGVNDAAQKTYDAGKKVGGKISDSVPDDVKEGLSKTGEGIVDTGEAIGRAAAPVVNKAAQKTGKFLRQLHLNVLGN